MNEDTRWCPSGQHRVKTELFRAAARDCKACEAKRRYHLLRAAGNPGGIGMAKVALHPTAEFPGVDIDAIHYKRGRVNGQKRTA